MSTIAQQAAEHNRAAASANSAHAIALQEYYVAVKRYDWELAEKKHTEAVDHFDAFLLAVRSQYKLSQEIVRLREHEDDGA